MSKNWNDKLTYHENIMVVTATICNFQGSLVSIAEEIRTATNSKFKIRSIEMLENLNMIIEDAITSLHNLNDISINEIHEILEKDDLPYDRYD